MKAGKLPGKATTVGIALWYLAGCKGRKTELRLTNNLMARFGVNRKMKYRALDALEGAGLIAVTHLPNKNFLVSIKEVR
jgi:hypothetical protein